MLRHAFLKYSRILVIPMAAGIWLAAAHPASAAQEIVLNADQAQLVRLPMPPATVVVGNPAIADVTTDGSALFFQPKGFGVTNVFALDGNGKKLGDYVVRVIYDDTYSITMYQPGSRQTYSCRNNCETTMRIGDGADYFDLYKKQAEDKFGLVTNQATAGDATSTSGPVTLTTDPAGLPSN